MDDQSNSIWLKEVYLPSLIQLKSTNLVLAICWILMMVVGVLMVGISTSNYQLTFDYCLSSEKICLRQFKLDKSCELFFYIVVSPYYQNNRFYLESFSNHQIHGKSLNSIKCAKLDTYESLGINHTLGGYRILPTAQAHPCGQPMKHIINDNIVLIDSNGSQYIINSGNLVSNFYLLNHFIRLPNYQVSQWIDVTSNNFANWLIIPFTSTKYVLMGRAKLKAGTYSLILRNNYITNNQFTKKLLVTQLGVLGDSNIILGFIIFIVGMIITFIHMFICCQQSKVNNDKI